MHRLSVILWAAIISLCMANNLFASQIEWNLNKTLTLESTPLDFAVSDDGRRVFVLEKNGVVSIHSADGKKKAEIASGTKADSLTISPDGTTLYLSDPKTGQIQILDVASIHAIPVDGSPFKGPEDAKVTIVEFSEFQCPYCSKVPPQLEQVMKAYPEDVKVVFKNFPLRSHPWAMPAALAGLAAQRQGKFGEMHDLLFQNQRQLSHEKFQQIAEQLGLDMAQFNADLKDPALAQQVARDMQLGRQSGVRGTPTLFVNGRRLKNRSFAGFKELIDKELGN